MSDAVVVQVVLPERADDALSEALRDLTEAICAIDPEQDTAYGLGGENGYGCDIDTPLFMMHRFCWCGDERTCPWCRHCTCEYEGGAHFGAGSGGACDYCTGQFALEQGGLAGMGAPNFWHKPSGLRVYWYKWIGRSNDVFCPPGADAAALVRECIESLPPAPKTGREE